MKRDYFPSAVGSLAGAILSAICFILVWFNSVEWIEELLVISVIVSALATLAGIYSLIIKKSWQAFTGFFIGIVLLTFYIALIYSLQHMCVIC